ncbi:NAD-dependent epimerase/dehydratase [Enterococcus casseliflavus EC10]|uniref:NAD-dependent epimerase/dehydratase family protein n=1 Tax=Enterococcus casseliflavus TaxID=37734 RepID=UPI0001B6FDE1|nr:NAD-dependent epimerase/dehydratase family protein [Enterococcus casseliflavus]EEV34949.1 NAD-dependent epimerase/dehydratase [Enterococcus casseliflavus EC10]
MKRILITGANSYIGTSFEKWMQQFGDNFQIDTVDMHGEQWKEKDFSQYDSVFHVAGIAHADVSKVSEETKQLYYKVNCDLAVETAEKYKNDLNGKNGQFIYMSSIIIYGEETNINKKRVITPETQPNPSNFYGDSKLKAEKKLTPLKSDTFRIAIIRPPMIYGEGSKGNYQQLVKIAQKLPVFPNIENERSMLSIDHLCDFIKNRIEFPESGIFFPQDPQYVRTSFMVKEIAASNGKKVKLFSGLNWLIYLLGYFPGKIGKLVNKAFGNLVYENSDMEIKL